MLIGFSLFVALIFLAAFVWAIRTDQYDDEYGDSMRLLHDDLPETENPNNI